MIGPATVALFYALLAVVANVALVVVVVLRVAARRSDRAAGLLEELRETVGGLALTAACVVALAATLGSLYFSEVAGFVPCRLCWFQRIAMYPLVVILGIAAWRRDSGVRPYAAGLALIGAVIAAYHYALEWIPALDSGACAVDAPCTVIWFRELGFVTLPYLALSGFLLVLALLTLAPRRNER